MYINAKAPAFLEGEATVQAYVPKTSNRSVSKIKLMKNIIKKGSVGLAESYIRGDFETNNLQDLIAVSYTHLRAHET